MQTLLRSIELSKGENKIVMETIEKKETMIEKPEEKPKVPKIEKEIFKEENKETKSPKSLLGDFNE